MRKQTRFTATIILITLLIVGCGPAEPTTTPVPPTTTPVPPADTPAPAATQLLPTETPVPATPTVVPSEAPVLLEPAPGPEDIDVLVLLPEDYGANHYLNVNNFELFGWRVTLAGVKGRVSACPAFAATHGCPTIEVDLRVSEIEDITAYDIVAISPAKGQSLDLLESEVVRELIAAASEAGLVLYAPCRGVGVLAAAGVLEGRTVTGKAGEKEEVEAGGGVFIEGGWLPVVDGNIVTAVRGNFFSFEIGAAIARALEGQMPEGPVGGKEPAEGMVAGSFDHKHALWTKTFGGASAEGARALAQTEDGGFILAGYTYSFGAGNSDLFLLNTDAQGDALWAGAFGGSGWEYGHSVALAPDGGYVAAGYTTSAGAGSRDVYLVKVDASGNELWSRTYGGPGADVGQAVWATEDGGYIVVGYTESVGGGGEDVYLVKTDAEGSELWSKVLDGEGAEVGNSIVEVAGGGYLIAGAFGSEVSDNREVYLIRTDAGGNPLWSRTFGHDADDYEWGSVARATLDGGFVVVGNSDHPLQQELSDIYLLKVDEKGSEVWSTVFGRSQFYDFGDDVYPTQDGGYAIVGATRFGSGDSDVYLARADAEGTVLWKKWIGGPWPDRATAVLETAEGDIVLAGQTRSFGAGSYDVWLIKVAGSEGQ